MMWSRWQCEKKRSKSLTCLPRQIAATRPCGAQSRRRRSAHARRSASRRCRCRCRRPTLRGRRRRQAAARAPDPHQEIELRPSRSALRRAAGAAPPPAPRSCGSGARQAAASSPPPSPGTDCSSSKNGSLRMRSAFSSLFAVTVAVRGVSQRMAISPTKSPSCSTAIGISPVVGRDDHLGVALDDHVGGVADIALA